MSFKDRQLFLGWVFCLFWFFGWFLGFFMLHTKSVVSCQIFAQLLSTSVLSELFSAMSTIHTFFARKLSSHRVRFLPWHDVLAWKFMSQSALLLSASLLHGLLDVSSVALWGFWGRPLMHLLLVHLLSQEIAIAAVGCHFLFQPSISMDFVQEVLQLQRWYSL